MNRICIDELNGKNGFSECKSILTTTTYNLQKLTVFSTLPVPCFPFLVAFSAIHTNTNIGIIGDNI